MNAAGAIAGLAFDANSNLAESLRAYEKARATLLAAHEQQGIAIRALGAVTQDHDELRRGHELELRVVLTLNAAGEPS